MRVLSGRATGGAHSVLRAVFGGLCAVLALIAGGCGSSTINYGTVVMTVSSDRSPFTAYVVDLFAFYLVLDNGNTNYGFTGSQGTGKTMDFVALGDNTELFGAPAVPEGTYTSATVTFNYSAQETTNLFAAALFVDVNGSSVATQLIDPTLTSGTTTSPPGTITYTVKFDPAHPLVVKRGTPVSLDFHFDMNAASAINTSTSPPTVAVRPYMTASTQPVITKTLRARGDLVTTDTAGSNFTINARSFFDTQSSLGGYLAQGAETIATNDQTTYNVSGRLYRGSAGLAAIASLAQNTTISAYGSLGDTTGLTPVFNATEVYAGFAIENPAAYRGVGTIVSRSGNTLHLHNTEVVLPPGSQYSPNVNANVVEFFNDVEVLVDDKTVVSVDRQPELQSTIQSISVGQQVDLEGGFSLDTAGNLTMDASGGLLRITPTTAWGTINAATPGSSTVNLVTLGTAKPSAFNFAGTGATGATDADPANYVIGTGSVDLSGQVGGLFRFDGTVPPFGSAAPSASAPDFTASAVTASTSPSPVQGVPSSEQVLVIEWTGTGTTAPFSSASDTGLVVNMQNASLGTNHYVQTGPSYLDLTNPAVTPTIVPDPSLNATAHGQFSIGTTSTTGISVFNSFSDYVKQFNTAITSGGTNTISKLVAVGSFNATTNVFTAYRIDMVQLP